MILTNAGRALIVFLSTPSARRATDTGRVFRLCQQDFYPRPPRGGRPPPPFAFPIPEDRFLSTPSARRATDEDGKALYKQLFLSTPSARRATLECCRTRPRQRYFYPRPPRGGRRGRCSQVCWRHHISIHALREEGDGILPMLHSALLDFYPRPPRGGRQQKQRENTLLLSHYTPLCTNCKEMLAKQTAKSHRYLRKRLVFRCEASRKTMCATGSHWPDIKRSTRCLGQILGAVQRARPWSGSCCPAGRTADCPRQGRSGRSALL